MQISKKAIIWNVNLENSDCNFQVGQRFVYGPGKILEILPSRFIFKAKMAANEITNNQDKETPI